MWWVRGVGRDAHYVFKYINTETNDRYHSFVEDEAKLLLQVSVRRLLARLLCFSDVSWLQRPSLLERLTPCESQVTSKPDGQGSLCEGESAGAHSLCQLRDIITEVWTPDSPTTLQSCWNVGDWV